MLFVTYIWAKSMPDLGYIHAVEHAFVKPTFWMYASQSNIGLINPNVPSQANVRECRQIAANSSSKLGSFSGTRPACERFGP